jgi:alcohol dehydrogenase
VLNGKIQDPGTSVAIVGAGPVGLATLLTAQFYSPGRLIMIDLDDKRLEVAKRFGATDTINSGKEDAAARVMVLTDGKGADAVIEAVGVPETFELCQQLVAPGGVIANIGVHGHKTDLHLENLWDRNIAITTRLVDTATPGLLLRAVAARKLDPAPLITHRYSLDRILDAYDTFSRASETGALKVLITAST